MDERGVALRATWHPETETCNLSIWHDHLCVGSFRLDVGDVPDVAGFLTSVMSDWALEVRTERLLGEHASSPLRQEVEGQSRRERLLRPLRRYLVGRSLR